MSKSVGATAKRTIFENGYKTFTTDERLISKLEEEERRRNTRLKTEKEIRHNHALAKVEDDPEDVIAREKKIMRLENEF